MANTTDPAIPKIVYTNVSRRVMEGELLIRQHVIEYIISGSSEVYFNGKTHHYQAGDYRFAVKNRLSRFVKQPPAGGSYRSVAICIDDATLRELAPAGDQLAPRRFENVFRLRPNRLFKNYIDSLAPYLEHRHDISGDLLKAKIREAVLVFLSVNPELQQVLYDFSVPGKIDLAAFMEAHYRYNGDLRHFAFLTGRSISTFKRDFAALFQTTPGKWLTGKKLEDAYYLICEKKLKPTEACLEAGFNDYSHFFAAFKRRFGMAPSAVSSRLRPSADQSI